MGMQLELVRNFTSISCVVWWVYNRNMLVIYGDIIGIFNTYIYIYIYIYIHITWFFGVFAHGGLTPRLLWQFHGEHYDKSWDCGFSMVFPAVIFRHTRLMQVIPIGMDWYARIPSHIIHFFRVPWCSMRVFQKGGIGSDRRAHKIYWQNLARQNLSLRFFNGGWFVVQHWIGNLVQLDTLLKHIYTLRYSNVTSREISTNEDF